jgi:hypothetical protein
MALLSARFHLKVNVKVNRVNSRLSAATLPQLCVQKIYVHGYLHKIKYAVFFKNNETIGWL